MRVQVHESNGQARTGVQAGGLMCASRCSFSFVQAFKANFWERIVLILCKANFCPKVGLSTCENKHWLPNLELYIYIYLYIYVYIYMDIYIYILGDHLRVHMPFHLYPTSLAHPLRCVFGTGTLHIDSIWGLPVAVRSINRCNELALPPLKPSFQSKQPWNPRCSLM